VSRSTRWPPPAAFCLSLGLAVGLALGTPAPGGQLDRTELTHLFSQGKDFFHQANAVASTDPATARELYRKAALRFERIARDGGVRNGKLFYNIGNIHFRLGDLGRAILSYRRAEQLIPNDPKLRQSLDTARARTPDKIEPRQRTRVLHTLFFWHYDLTARVRLIAFVVLFWVLWVLAAVRLFRPGGAPRWAIGLAAVLALALLASLAVEWATAARHEPGVVLADEVVARKGDADTYQPSFKEPLHAGAEFELLENRGQWLHVELADGRRCWLPAAAVGLVGRLTPSP